MKLRFNQIFDHLRKPLAPIYLISGDEPFQLMEAADAVRAAARDQEYLDRQVLHVDKSFDWNALASISANMSLFGERQLIDLRIPSGKPGTQGAAALQALAQDPPPDTLVLIQSAKVPATNAWVKAVERSGVLLQVWPLNAGEIGAWVTDRFRRRQIKVSPEAVALLSERVEGNLLAAAQEVDMLALLCDGGEVNVEAVLDAVADSSRYNVFELADACLAGDGKRTARILHGLREEGIAQPLVLWALTREIRAMTQIAEAVASGTAPEAALAPVWQKRKALFRAALERGANRRWRILLRRCAHLDRIIKGQAAGNAWDELLQLTLAFAGQPLFKDLFGEVSDEAAVA